MILKSRKNSYLLDNNQNTLFLYEMILPVESSAISIICLFYLFQRNMTKRISHEERLKDEQSSPKVMDTLKS